MPIPSAITRLKWWQKPLPMFLMGASFAASFLLMWAPPLAALVSHSIDRMKNGVDRNDELGVRAKFYRNQIAAQLGISPDRVGAHEFRMAAQLNPQLAAAYHDVMRKENRENRDSMLINTGTAVAGGFGRLAGEAAMAAKTAGAGVQALKMTAGGITGGAIGALFHKEHVSAQDAAEAIAADMQRAQAQGIDPRQIVTPRAVFMIRLSQDEALAQNIKKTYGKAFNQLSPQEQDVVMSQVPALTNAVTSEAHAVATGILPVQELMARAPNLDSAATRYAGGTNAQPRPASFVEAESQRRAAAAAQAVQGPAV